LPILDKAEQSDSEKSTLRILSGWDNEYDPENPAPAIFEAFYYELIQNIFLDELGEDLFDQFISREKLASFVIDRMVDGQDISWCDDVATPGQVETAEDMVLASFRSAVSYLEGVQGSDINTWKWGNMHQVVLNHPMGSVNLLKLIFNLDRGPWSPGGSPHTICPFTYELNDRYRVYWGASQRHIFTTWDWDQSWSVIPTGISGIPASDYYCNQSDLYMNKQYHPDYFSRKTVEENAKYKAVFSTK